MMTPEPNIVFDVRNLSYSYGKVDALHELSLRIRQGERIALLGANGSGKSTLLRLLAALSFPDSGSICFSGEDLTQSKLEDEAFFYRFRRCVGIVFQNPDVQLFNASVFDEVAFGPLQLGLPREEIGRRVNDTLAEMGISDLRDRPPHRLSGGEKKRVALASVLVLDPEVLLLDEPIAALDPGSAAKMTDWLASWKNGSKTIITATHDLDVLEEISDRCFVLEAGRFISEGDPVQVLHDVALLEHASLIRPHRHKHGSQMTLPHPHVHRTE